MSTQAPPAPAHAAPEPAPEPPPEPDLAPAVPRIRGRRRWRFGVQSKLLMMLLLTSILSALVVGCVGYQTGKNSMQNAAFNQLTQVRDSRAHEITAFFDQLENSLVIYTRGSTAIEAVRAFTAGYDELQSSTISTTQATALEKYYSGPFVTALDSNTGTTADPLGFLPKSPAERYLQANYTAPYTDFSEAIKLDDAADGSAWSTAHARFHDYFRELAQRFGYEDALLLDTRGNVVYSAYSGADLGSNIETGPYRDSLLSDAYQQALTSNAVDYVGLTDYGRYQPSAGVPTAWAVSPIGVQGNVEGVLALQLPINAINDVMTGDRTWEAEGLGATGETYLAADDLQMRSVSRLLVQDPVTFQRQAIAAGADPAVAAAAVRTGSTILELDTNTGAVADALRGQSGTMIATDYLGQEALVAYAPLDIAGLRWVIVAKIDAAEAFGPVDDFTKNLILATAAMIFLVCMASLILAQVFTRPLRRLVTGVRQVAAGDLSAEVDVRSKDEFGDLSSAFNDMSRNLRTKQDLLDEQKAENDRLLLTLMPEAVAKRYRKGEKTITEDHHDVSVIFADIVGFDALTAQLPPAQSLPLLNDLVRSFDDAGTRLGIEKIRTIRTGYLASCGLTVPRVDNSRRSVEFAVEMHRILQRFNVKNGTELSLRAGVDTGTVTSGLVGRSTLVYDMWGDTVNLANQIQGVAGRPGIFVTGRIYDQMRDVMQFSSAGEISTRKGLQQVWRVETDSS